MDTYRVEHEFVLACARRSISPVPAATIGRLLEGPFDWDHCLSIAARHQVLPTLHASLIATVGQAVPAKALEALRLRVVMARQRSRQLTGELIRLSHLATAAGLTLLCFKGPVLAAMIYGDVEARQYDDLDVLVDRAAFMTTAAFLVSLGYRCTSDCGWQATFKHDTTRGCVDLHQQLTPCDFPVPLAFGRLWARREVVPIERGRVETLSLEDLLLVLCIQVARDAWEGTTKLAKICDIAQVIVSKRQIDWKRVTEEARRLRVERVLQFALLLTARMFRIAPPPPAGCVIGDRALAGLVRQEEEALFAESPESPGSVTGHLFHLQVRERWRDRLYPYYLNLPHFIVPNASDRNMVALPASLSVLYYLLRPLRLIHRYGRYLFGNLPKQDRSVRSP